jgi:hypothetical protein
MSNNTQKEDYWPNNHSWTCACKECDEAWGKAVAREDTDIGIDDEKERELDILHSIDGW